MPTIADMQDGQVAYTLPWAFYAPCDGALVVVRGEYPAHTEPTNTATVKITKHGRFYYADVSALEDMPNYYPNRSWDLRRVLRT